MNSDPLTFDCDRDYERRLRHWVEWYEARGVSVGRSYRLAARKAARR